MAGTAVVETAAVVATGAVVVVADAAVVVTGAAVVVTGGGVVVAGAAAVVAGTAVVVVTGEAVVVGAATWVEPQATASTNSETSTGPSLWLLTASKVDPHVKARQASRTTRPTPRLPIPVVSGP